MPLLLVILRLRQTTAFLTCGVEFAAIWVRLATEVLRGR